MNAEQKTAWLMIVLFLLCCGLYLGLLPFVGWKAAFAVFGLFGLAGLSPLIFSYHKRDGAVSVDERDRQIVRRAGLAGGMASYLVFVLGCMTTWGLRRAAGSESVDVDVLPFLVFCGAITLFMVRSVTLLVFYRQGGGYGDG